MGDSAAEEERVERRAWIEVLATANRANPLQTAEASASALTLIPSEIVNCRTIVGGRGDDLAAAEGNRPSPSSPSLQLPRSSSSSVMGAPALITATERKRTSSFCTPYSLPPSDCLSRPRMAATLTSLSPPLSYSTALHLPVCSGCYRWCYRATMLVPPG